MMIRYFAYGSNMLTKRLQRRCSSAAFQAVASTQNYEFTFSKRSIDHSGKGNLMLRNGGRVYGALFDLDESQLPALDEFEGVRNGYNREGRFPIETLSGERAEAVTYLADPAYVNLSL